MIKNFILRTPEETDLGFIYETWLLTYWKNSAIKDSPPEIYLENQREIIKKLLNTSTVLLLCYAEDADSIIGYVVYETIGSAFILHWLHIRTGLRGNGFARELLKTVFPNAGNKEIAITHQSDVALKNLKKKYKIQYDPFFIMNRMREKV